MIRVLWLLLSRQQQWWNPASWFNDVKGAAVTSFDDVKKWVLKIVHDAALGLSWTFTQIEDGLKAGLNAADSAINDVRDIALNNLSGLTQFITELIPSLVHEASSYADNLFHSAEAELTSVARSVEHVALSAVHDVSAEVTRIYNGTIVPLVHDVEAVPHEIATFFDDAWHAIDRNVIQPLEHEAGTIVHQLDDAFHWIATEGEYVVRLVRGAEHWLLWFGEHALSEITGLPGIIDHLLHWGTVESWIMESEQGIVSEADALAGAMFNGQ